MSKKPSIKSLAGHVMATGEATDEEAVRLAAYVNGDAAPARTTRTTRTTADLKRIASKLEGVEGQSERLAAVRAEIERGTQSE